MKAAELRQKSKAELETILQEKRVRGEELLSLLLQKKTKNVKELSGVKKDIARIKTILNS